MNIAKLTAHELLVILDITRRLAEQRLVQPLMSYVAGTVFELVAAERCAIVLFAEDGASEVQVARDRKGNPLDATDQMSRSILERVRLSMTPLLVNDALSEKLLQDVRSVKSLGLRSVMCVPLISYGQTVGAIYVENRSIRGQFTDEHLVPLVLLSNQVVTALENARVYEALETRIAERTRALAEANAQLEQRAAELHEQSIRDSLTGLYNRRYFNEQLPLLFERIRRYAHPLSLACIDVDHFKRVNDTLLHSGGDQVLVMIASILRERIRGADIVARNGGEEFVVMLPETSCGEALLACERLRTAIENHPWHEFAPELRVTVSIGLADDTGCANAEELLRRADTRLYLAKSQGRNRVVAVDGAPLGAGGS